MGLATADQQNGEAGMTASVTIGLELVIILALAWLARWALDQAKAAKFHARELAYEIDQAKLARSEAVARGNHTRAMKRRTKRDQVTAALRLSPVVTIVQDDD